jgi:hypothetical protein
MADGMATKKQAVENYFSQIRVLKRLKVDFIYKINYTILAKSVF